MSSTSKGDKLEDAFYHYLVDQKDRGDLVFGAYPATNCKIYKKKSYFCRERQSDVEFDIVLELYRTGGAAPHLYVIFECKNHEGSISEIYVNDFSSKIGRIFPDATKGIIVVNSRLQSGAEMVARSRAMGIVKFDEQGVEIVADRKGDFVENSFLRAQMFQESNVTKSLKFSGFYDGNYFYRIDDLLTGLASEEINYPRYPSRSADLSAPFLSIDKIKSKAKELHQSIDYISGVVDLVKICDYISVDLHFVDHEMIDIDGYVILGSAIFSKKTITINSHFLHTRERFTLAHEIGHFVLDHERYLSAESIVERDLFVTKEKLRGFNYDRLEYQANAFAAELILPDTAFIQQTNRLRRDLDIKDRGHGYIYVDNQADNILIYNELLSRLSNYFEVSKQAIEVKMRKMKMLTDQRKRNEALPISHFLSDMGSVRKQ